MTIFASTLYRPLASHLRGFEKVTAKKLYRYFVDNGAEIEITQNQIIIRLQKKVYNPILFESNIFQQPWEIPWLGDIQLQFEPQNTT